MGTTNEKTVCAEFGISHAWSAPVQNDVKPRHSAVSSKFTCCDAELKCGLGSTLKSFSLDDVELDSYLEKIEFNMLVQHKH